MIDNRRPEQQGQPWPRNVRCPIQSSHSWSGPSGHFHQTFLPEPATTPVGNRSPFLVGCHSAAISGNSDARLLVTETAWPAQAGHPEPDRVRWSTFASHSWSGPSGHFHQTFLPEPATTPVGNRSPFLVGCHCAATSGNKSANDSPGFGTANATPPVFPNATTTRRPNGYVLRQPFAFRSTERVPTRFGGHP